MRKEPKEDVSYFFNIPRNTRSLELSLCVSSGAVSSVGAGGGTEVIVPVSGYGRQTMGKAVSDRKGQESSLNTSA